VLKPALTVILSPVLVPSPPSQSLAEKVFKNQKAAMKMGPKGTKLAL
jgi:hypothetical protein